MGAIEIHIAKQLRLDAPRTVVAQFGAPGHVVRPLMLRAHGQLALVEAPADHGADELRRDIERGLFEDA